MSCRKPPPPRLPTPSFEAFPEFQKLRSKHIVVKTCNSRVNELLEKCVELAGLLADENSLRPQDYDTEDNDMYGYVDLDTDASKRLQDQQYKRIEAIKTLAPEMENYFAVMPEEEAKQVISELSHQVSNTRYKMSALIPLLAMCMLFYMKTFNKKEPPDVPVPVYMDALLLLGWGS